MARVTDGTGAEQPNDLRVAEVSGDEPGTGVVGTVTIPANQAGGATHAEKNPLGEDEITVRIRDGFEFFFMGDKVRAGDPDFKMAISQARAASIMLDEVLPDGSLRPIPHEQQRIDMDVPRAAVAGRPRHERIGLLADEEKALEERLARVREQRQHEETVASQQAGQKDPAVPAAQPNPAPETVNVPGPVSPSPAFTPGTTGAPGTTAVPARPGEPSDQGGANSGPVARK